MVINSNTNTGQTPSSKALSIKAKYDFRGLDAEFKKTICLDTDENIIAKKKVKSYTGGIILARTCFLVITNKRLALLKHYAFRPDLIISVPFHSISDIEICPLPLFTVSLFPPRINKYVYTSLDLRTTPEFKVKKLAFYCYGPEYSRRWRPRNKATINIYKILTRKLCKNK